VWPVATALPALRWPAGSAVLIALMAVCYYGASRAVRPPGTARGIVVPALLLAGLTCGIGAVAAEVSCHWHAGLHPQASSYAAVVYMASVLNAQLIAAAAVMTCFLLARHASCRLDRVRRASLDNTCLLIYYIAAQALIGLAAVHGLPHLLAR
jgi:cytochrome c oxidase subunit I+III